MSKKGLKTERKKNNKKRIYILIGGLNVVAFLIVWQLNMFNPEQIPLKINSSTGDLSVGKTIFNENCAACHGPDARGEDPSQPRGGTKANGSLRSFS